MHDSYLASVVSVAFYYGILGLSYALIYKMTNTILFTLGIIYTSAAYITYFFHDLNGMPIIGAMLISVILCAFVGGVGQGIVYELFERKQSSKEIQMIASLGIYVLLQNLISILFGDDIVRVSLWSAQEGFLVMNVIVTPAQMVTIVSGVIVALVMYCYTRFTTSGIYVSAIICNRNLAISTGLKVERIVLVNMIICSAITGIAGNILAIDANISPTIGMNAMMMAVVIVFISDTSNPVIIFMTALILSTLQHIVSWYLGSLWQYSVSFMFMALIMLIRKIRTDKMIMDRVQ